MPIYLKKVFADDPIFKEVKIVVSLYGDGFDKPLDAGMKEKIANEGVKDKKLSILDTPSYENLCRYVMEYADGIILASDAVTPKLSSWSATAANRSWNTSRPTQRTFSTTTTDSMIRSSKIRRAAELAAVLTAAGMVFFTGCTKVDDRLGAGYQPGISR